MNRPDQDPEPLRSLVESIRKGYYAAAERQGVDHPRMFTSQAGVVRFEIDFDPDNPADEMERAVLNSFKRSAGRAS